MFQELKFQLSSAILTVVTIAAVVAGILNYEQNRKFPLPDDGVTWVDSENSTSSVIDAYQVVPESAGRAHVELITPVIASAPRPLSSSSVACQ